MEATQLDDLFLTHVQHSERGDHTWADDLLHVSDLCSCPRAVGLRILGEAKRNIVGEELRKKSYRYYLANWLHEECFTAWGEAGILVEKEVSIRGYLPPGWTGRFDAIIDYLGGRRIIDVKTKEYIGKTAQFPDIKHMAQIACYHMFIGEAWHLTANPILYYIQRNLQHHEAQECTVDITENTEYFVREEMKKLEEARASLPDLAPILQRTIKHTGKKVKGNYMEISAVTNKSCTTEWCDYSGGSCEADVGEDLVAWRNGDDWVLTDEGQATYEAPFLAFLEGEQLDDYEGS